MTNQPPPGSTPWGPQRQVPGSPPPPPPPPRQQRPPPWQQPPPPQGPPQNLPPPPPRHQQPPQQVPSQPFHPPDPSPPQTGRARRTVPLWVLAAAAVVVLVVGGAVGYLVGNRSTEKVLDRDKVAAGVTGVLQNDYDVSNVQNMSCPADMKVQIDARYTCTFTAGTARASVDIVLQNDTGQYVVQAPKG